MMEHLSRSSPSRGTLAAYFVDELAPPTQWRPAASCGPNFRFTALRMLKVLRLPAFCNDRFTSSDFSHRKFVVFPALAIGRPEDRRHPIPSDMYLAIFRLLQFEISPEYQDFVSPCAEDSGFHLGLIFRFSLKAD
jgi:hypothetical protein